MDNLEEIYAKLKKAGVRVHIDDRENYNPGFKFNYWELRGTPIRIELGRKDLEKGETKVVRRDNEEKVQIKQSDLEEYIPNLLNQIHEDMYQRALKTRDQHVSHADTWE